MVPKKNQDGIRNGIEESKGPMEWHWHSGVQKWFPTRKDTDRDGVALFRDHRFQNNFSIIFVIVSVVGNVVLQ